MGDATASPVPILGEPPWCAPMLGTKWLPSSIERSGSRTRFVFRNDPSLWDNHGI
jgi:hypothetical protein